MIQSSLSRTKKIKLRSYKSSRREVEDDFKQI